MRVTLICRQCSTPFPVDPYLKDRALFCSRRCKNQAQRMPEEMRICAYCQNLFPLPPVGQIRQRQLYCSRDCGRKASIITRRDTGLRKFWTRVKQCNHEWLCIYCCWPWQAGLTGNGYGCVHIGGGKTRMANRVAWELHNERRMPDELFGAHYCHFRACCNPTHIHAATQKENMEDSVRDLRHYHGQRHHQAKLTAITRQEAFALRRQGWIIQRIADHLHVSYITIQKLLKGDTWKYEGH